MIKNIKFGDRLKVRRTECGLLQRELADKVGISNRNISSYEKNDRQPSYETLVKLAAVLDCSTDYLLGSVDVPNRFTGVVDGYKHELLIAENEADKPYSREQFENLIRKLESIGIDVEQLMKN